MFKKFFIFLFVLGFAVSANAMKIGQKRHHTHKTTVTKTVNDKVNINQASAKDLAKVKGLGEKKAKAIVAYRKRHGGFKTLDDLTKVKGIGGARLAKIKPNLTV